MGICRFFLKYRYQTYSLKHGELPDLENVMRPIRATPVRLPPLYSMYRMRVLLFPKFKSALRTQNALNILKLRLPKSRAVLISSGPAMEVNY
jgi:hypothetical protein